MIRHIRRTLFVLLACLTSVFFLAAQQTVNESSLGGRLVDTTGAVVNDALITVQNQATGISTKARSGTNGRFRLPYLSPGTYTVTVSARSFADQAQTVSLDPGANLDLSLTLRPASASTSVTTQATYATAIDTSTQIAATISPVEANQLPFLSRNFLDLALLAPGVSATNTAATQLFAETSAVPGQGLSVDSQRNFSNSFLIDGLSANDDAAGLVQTALPLDSISELQVVSSGGQAEFGRALGGYFNFVTRSGSDHLHGTAYGYLRNQRLDAANPLTHTVPPRTQAIFGASLGGPIVKGRAFFFANAEQRNLNQNGVITIAAPSAAQINSRLTAVGYPGQLLAIAPSSSSTLYSNPVRATNLFARIDDQLTSRDSLSARYSLYHVASQNSRGAGGLSYTSAAAALYDLDQTLAVSNIATLTPRTINETRGQWVRSLLDAPANDPTGPAVSISGVASFGTLSASPTARYDTLYELVDNLSHQFGSHSFRVGADFLFNDLTIAYPQSIRGNYAFSSLPNFLAGRYSTFTQSFGNPAVHQHNPNIGFYAQDEWQAAPSLTLNFGVRYDLQFLRALFLDTNNVSPRIGLAWTPFANKRTIVRAGYGLFYDRVPLRALSNALESDNNTTALTPGTFVTLALSYGQSGAPAFPAIDSGYNALNLPSNLRVSLSTMDPHMQNAYAQQGSLEVEQQLPRSLTLDLNYQHVRGEHLLISVNRNTPACLSSVDPVNLCRPNPALGNVKQYSSSAGSTYDGLQLSLTQRPSAWSSIRLSYAWSHALDDVSEFFFSAPINNDNIGEDWGRSDDDQRHRLSFDAIAHTSLIAPHGIRESLTRGWQLSGILQYDSKFPFNIVTGTNTIQTTSQRPCAPPYTLTQNDGINPCTEALPGAIIARNSGIGFDYFNLNARLNRTVFLKESLRLDLTAEAFNALNHRNNDVPNTTFGTGAFTAGQIFTGTPTAVADPRSIQLAARLTF
jgi:outer membrane receptor protein involved in Fe transport